jgi:alkaline phosphatase D
VRLTLGFGGGAGYTPWHERMWTLLDAQDFDAFLLLGDNVYIDTPEVPETQRYCYYRRQSRPEYRAFTASTPIFAIWDDHDFGDNDSEGGPDRDLPAWKRPVLKVFQENFANPYYGGSRRDPGVWFDTTMGDVDLFFLDCRYYRSLDSTKENRSMLGPVQLAWLKERLAQSTATFKIIASSVPWAQGVKGGSNDTWDGFPEEREDIFTFIEANRIDGVVLISADRHRSDAWRIPRPNGYDLYDFMSSKLTNVVSHGLVDGALIGYNEKCSFGKVEIDTAADDPTFTYTIVDIDGESQGSVTLKRSQLEHR